jgi:hypothetical protein
MNLVPCCRSQCTTQFAGQSPVLQAAATATFRASAITCPTTIRTQHSVRWLAAQLCCLAHTSAAAAAATATATTMGATFLLNLSATGAALVAGACHPPYTELNYAWGVAMTAKLYRSCSVRSPSGVLAWRLLSFRVVTILALASASNSHRWIGSVLLRFNPAGALLLEAF